MSSTSKSYYPVSMQHNSPSRCLNSPIKSSIELSDPSSKSIPIIYLNLDTFKTQECCLTKTHCQKQCPFYHSAKDKRRAILNYKDKLCSFISTNQTCPKGDQCEFAHNQVEERYHPSNYKKRFCTNFQTGDPENCKYSNFCSYAHSEDDINIELLHRMEQNLSFFIFHFKTVMCPLFNIKHDRGSCPYAHNFQDFRRRPDVYSYKSDPCPYWKFDAFVENYEDGCPNGYKCDKTHGWKEKDFHPLVYKVKACPNFGRCYKNYLCAFYHGAHDQRFIAKCFNENVFRIMPKNSKGQPVVNQSLLKKENFKNNAKLKKIIHKLSDESPSYYLQNQPLKGNMSNADMSSSCNSIDNTSVSSYESKKNPLTLEQIDSALEKINVYKCLFVD